MLDQPPSPPARPAHLVLAAGGVRVVSYIGALAEMATAGFTWRSISASSAGTFVGGLLAAGLSPAEIERRVIETDFKRFAGPKPLFGFLRMIFMRPFARYSESGAPLMFREMLGADPRFRDLKIPFATAGVDIISNRLLVYSSDTHPDMPVAEALRIAVGIPGMYPAYEPQGRMVVDAAIATQIPVWLATEHADELPIVVLRPRESLDPEPPQSFATFLTRAIESGIASRDHYLVSQIQRVRMIEPDCGRMAPDDFRRAERLKPVLLQRGRDAALSALSAFDAPPPTARPPLGTSGDDRAEARAERAMTSFHHAVSRETRDRVFICYAHEDREWLDRLQTFLKPYMRYDRMDVWDDTRIPPGARWLDEIQQALRATRVAVLLVTEDFLKSEFIAGTELPYFIKASEPQGLSLLPVAVSHCAWDVTPIKHYQWANDPQRPLDKMSEPEQNCVLTDVCKKVKAALAS